MKTSSSYDICCKWFVSDLVYYYYIQKKSIKNMQIMYNIERGKKGGCRIHSLLFHIVILVGSANRFNTIDVH